MKARRDRAPRKRRAGISGERFLRALLIAAGSVSLALAAVGIFIPFLPTTPFLLLSAACYARSSARLYTWLIGHRIFGRYIRSWREHRAIPLHAKIVLLSLLWLSIGATSVFATSKPAVRIILAGIAVGVTIVILKVRTMRDVK